eukprot:937004-Alexandrium_andersonii.AAC.1
MACAVAWGTAYLPYAAANCKNIQECRSKPNSASSWILIFEPQANIPFEHDHMAQFAPPPCPISKKRT